MDFISIIFIAVALSMDAFAVSITNGLTMCPLHVRTAFLTALFFGSFQALMPILGWLAGYQFQGVIEPADHWIAFGLLSFIGGKMIYESFILEKETQKVITIRTLFILAIATSIDAFAVGITFVFLKIAILAPVLIIGIITFFISLLGVWIGCKFGKNLSGKAEILGGIILIALGIKIVVEHLFFS